MSVKWWVVVALAYPVLALAVLVWDEMTAKPPRPTRGIRRQRIIAWHHFDPSPSGGRVRCRRCGATMLDPGAVGHTAAFASFTGGPDVCRSETP